MIHERVYTTVVRRADVNAHIYSSYRGEISISQVQPLCLKYSAATASCATDSSFIPWEMAHD